LKRLIETTQIISELKSKSFLISDADPSIVVPSFMIADKGRLSPAVGDYAANDLMEKSIRRSLESLGPSIRLEKPRRASAGD
jgi:hypothetical protein